MDGQVIMIKKNVRIRETIYRAALSRNDPGGEMTDISILCYLLLLSEDKEKSGYFQRHTAFDYKRLTFPTLEHGSWSKGGNRGY